MTVDDAQLVALIDDELDEEAKGRLLAQLAADEGLRQRYEALREAGAQMASSFDALLEAAPLSRLSAALPSEAVARPAPPPARGSRGANSRPDLSSGFLPQALRGSRSPSRGPRTIGVPPSPNIRTSIRTRRSLH